MAAGMNEQPLAHVVAGDGLVPPLWQDAAGDVPPGDALKQAFLGNNPIAPEDRSTRSWGAQTCPEPGQPPVCCRDRVAPHAGVRCSWGAVAAQVPASPLGPHV